MPPGAEQSKQAQTQHGEAERHHEAEGPEDDLHGRPFVFSPVFQSLDLAVPLVGQDHRAELGDCDLEMVLLSVGIGNGEED